MSEIVIRAENLGKMYHIGALQQAGSHYSYKSLRDAIADAAAAPFRSLRSLYGGSGIPRAPKDDTIWALKDVSFEVRQGEILGVVGANGAGKSTLLKVMSRITEPTIGRAEIHGRVGSLLEVGTGFHPELSGRDNVFLNGAILGMKRSEVAKNFDEIVAFAEVERFIDTPVKHYSSGMYLRLAFAVAAYLETEILIVDEVLAVGDASFQRKCLGKMHDVSSNQGRTVLFVSHNMAAIRALCTNGLLMQNGTVIYSGLIGSVAAAYRNLGTEENAEGHTVKLPPAPSRCDVWIETVTVLCNGKPKSQLKIGDRLSFRVKFRARQPISRPILGYLIRSSRGEDAVNANNYFLPSPEFEEPVTEGTIICDLGEVPLMAGTFSPTFWLCQEPTNQHHVEDVLYFEVEERNIWGTEHLPTRSLSCLWWPTEFKFLPGA